jgi:xylose isomerase
MDFDREIVYGCCSSVFGSHPDKFVQTGYKKDKSIDERLKAMAQVEDLKAVDLSGGEGGEVNRDNLPFIKDLFERYDLVPASISPDISGNPVFNLGAMCSSDKEVRKLALRRVFEAIDIAALLDCRTVNIWSGQDGYDYCFQIDYLDAFNSVVGFIREAADHNPDVDICIEYKPYEPRKRSIVPSAAIALTIVNEADRANVGITFDSGHSLNAGENMAAVVCFLKVFGDKLKYLHINDNYRAWDDDMIFASVHTVESLEFLYWLERTGYSGYYIFDVDPCREDSTRFVKANITMVKKLRKILGGIDQDNLRKIFSEHDAVGACDLIREILIR